jgi:DNA topoisomerase-1
MAAKELETTTIELAAGPYELRASATKTLFDGFAAVYTEGRDDGSDEEDAQRQLPEIAEGDTTTVRDVTPVQHFTEPPPRFTEATLIKALEEHGIGRPSTYAATISTILDRGYVRVEERRLHPELIGDVVTDFLVEHFGEYVDVAFTARMEEELDEVADGQRAWVPLLRAFFGPLRDQVDDVRKNVKRKDVTTEPSDEVCSEGHPMVIRLGRNGRFLACSLFPEHKESRPLPGEEQPPQEGEGEVCPLCGEGTLVGKRGRFGPFVGCSRYPDCTFIKKEGPPPPEPLPFEVVCPKNQDGHLLTRRARRTGNVFWGCSNYPKCDYTTNFEPLGATHDADDGPVARHGDEGICLTCGAAIPLPEETELVGARLAGGPANPEALARPARGGARRGRAGGAATARTGKTRAAGRSGGAAGSRGAPARRSPRRTGSAPDA